MINVADLYSRNHEIIIGEKVVINGQPKQNQEPPNALKFLNRCVFRIEKTSTAEGNKATIKLYNISSESRNLLEAKENIVFLRVGYGDNLATIFIGDILRREITRDGPDIVYSLECGDTEKQLKNAIVRLNFGNNVTSTILLNEAIKQLGVSIGYIKDFKEVVYPKNFSFLGRAGDLINELTQKQGLLWSIQDGEIRIFPPNKGDQSEAVLIGSDSGLIGFPTKTIDGLKFRSLINPELRVGGLVQVNSKLFQGDFGENKVQLASASLVESGDITVIRRIEYIGDTRGGDWFADVETVVRR